MSNHVKIQISKPNETRIEVGGVEQTGVTHFKVEQSASPKGDLDLATLTLTRLALPDAEHEYSLEIEGEAELIELFMDEARRAAAEQRMAVGSFVLHEHDEPELRTLGEILLDAKRYRAIRGTLEQFPGTGIIVENHNDVMVGTASTPDTLDALADDMRKTLASKRAAEHTVAQPEPGLPS